MCTSYTSNATYSFKKEVAESKKEREKIVRRGGKEKKMSGEVQGQLSLLIVTHNFASSLSNNKDYEKFFHA